MTNPDINPKPLNTLRKHERLSSKQAFDALYHEGTPVFVNGIRFLIRLVPQPEDKCIAIAQVAFVVPKKYIRHAVHRNLIKRRLREHYRIRKNVLYKALAERELYCQLSIIYLSKKHYSYTYLSSIFDKAMVEVIHTLFRLSEQTTPSEANATSEVQ